MAGGIETLEEYQFLRGFCFLYRYKSKL